MEDRRNSDATRIFASRPTENDYNFTIRQEKDLGIVEGMGIPFAILNNVIAALADEVNPRERSEGQDYAG